MKKGSRSGAAAFSLICLSCLSLLRCPLVYGQGLADQIGALSGNSGQYSNRIARVELAVAFIEVCFVDGDVQVDQHIAGERTNGGDCAPGDIGWIIEKNERNAKCWDAAKAECLKVGMRLPEPFEFKYSCDNATAFGLTAMSGNYEWASNSALPIADSVRGSGLGSTIIGNSGCGQSTWEWVGRSDTDQCDARPYRCVQ